MQEVWKNIEGYEGIYLISNLGRCRNIKNGNLMKVNNSFKYPRYVLSKNGKNEKLYIHRLVAKAFIPNPMNYITVNHIDENHDNYSECNLEWLSSIDNSRAYCDNHNYNMGVAQYDSNETLIKVYISARQAGRAINKSYTGIINCCSGRRKTAYGFIWKYC
ncbi:MAG: hypothetical protein K0R34_3619 [Herbinix sp.]|jgi:flavorubredoxin|nr:hypothetical protein [Herbinix sp.]